MALQQKLEEPSSDTTKVPITPGGPTNGIPPLMLRNEPIVTSRTDVQGLEANNDCTITRMDEQHDSSIDILDSLYSSSIVVIPFDAANAWGMSSADNVPNSVGEVYITCGMQENIGETVGNVVNDLPDGESISFEVEVMPDNHMLASSDAISIDSQLVRNSQHQKVNAAKSNVLPEAWQGALSHPQRTERSNSNQSNSSAISDLIMNLLYTVVKKVETVQNRDVKAAQDKLNTAQEYLIDMSKAGEGNGSMATRKAALKELTKAKDGAELGYHGADDVIAKIHATRIICLTAMYSNYLKEMQEHVCGECFRRLRLLNDLPEVKSAILTVWEYSRQPSSAPSFYSILTQTTCTAPTQLQQDIVQEVCKMNELLFRLFFSGGLVSSSKHWPMIDSHSPLELAYDGTLLAKTESYQVAIPAKEGGRTGFVDIISVSEHVTLLSKNARFVVKTNLGVDAEAGSIKLLTTGNNDRLTDDCAKVHFTMDRSDRAYTFSPASIERNQKPLCSQQSDDNQRFSDSLKSDGCQKLSLSPQRRNRNEQHVQRLVGSLQSVNVVNGSVNNIEIDHNIHGALHTCRRQHKCAPYVVMMGSSDGVVTFVVTSNCDAWLVTIDDESGNVLRNVSLKIHPDALPLQKNQCCLHQGSLFLLHVNALFNPSCDLKRKAANKPSASTSTSTGKLSPTPAMIDCDVPHPGLYKFDTATGAQSDCSLHSTYLRKHSGRLVSTTSDRFILQELRDNNPSAKEKHLAILSARTLEPMIKWKHAAGSINGCLRCCMSPDGAVAIVLDETDLVVYDMHTRGFLATRRELRKKNLVPSAVCWYGERHVLLSFSNTIDIDKIPIRM